jgi:hypothetical protein
MATAAFAVLSWSYLRRVVSSGIIPAGVISAGVISAEPTTAVRLNSTSTTSRPPCHPVITQHGSPIPRPDFIDNLSDTHGLPLHKSYVHLSPHKLVTHLHLSLHISLHPSPWLSWVLDHPFRLFSCLNHPSDNAAALSFILQSVDLVDSSPTSYLILWVNSLIWHGVSFHWYHHFSMLLAMDCWKTTSCNTTNPLSMHLGRLLRFYPVQIPIKICIHHQIFTSQYSPSLSNNDHVINIMRPWYFHPSLLGKTPIHKWTN